MSSVFIWESSSLSSSHRSSKRKKNLRITPQYDKYCISRGKGARPKRVAHAFGLKPRIWTTLRRGRNANCMIVIKGDLSGGAEVIHSEVTIISCVQSLYFVCVFCVTNHATTRFLSVCTWKHNPHSLPRLPISLSLLLSNTFTAFFPELICFHLPYVSRRYVLVLTGCALGSLGHKSVSTS